MQARREESEIFSLQLTIKTKETNPTHLEYSLPADLPGKKCENKFLMKRENIIGLIYV